MGCESRPCYSFLVPSTATSRSVLRSLGRRSPSIFRASRSPHHAASVDAEPQRRLAYYASQLPGKDTWFQTIEGYRIYKNVPISRTGSQQYIGREIKKNPGYKPEWGIGDDEMVTVYRPLEEVSSPEAVASKRWWRAQVFLAWQILRAPHFSQRTTDPLWGCRA